MPDAVGIGLAIPGLLYLLGQIIAKILQLKDILQDAEDVASSLTTLASLLKDISIEEKYARNDSKREDYYHSKTLANAIDDTQRTMNRLNDVVDKILTSSARRLRAWREEKGVDKCLRQLDSNKMTLITAIQLSR